MVFDTLIIGFLVVLREFLQFIPQMPETPEVFLTLADMAHQFVFNSVSVLAYFFSPFLMVTMLVLSVALIAFDQIYYMALWGIRKIPFINVK